MNILIYCGEAFTTTLDLDTSNSDATYDLSGITPRLRIAPIGSAISALAKDLTVDDEDAGTITLLLTDAETADLSEGVYSWQVMDDDTSLVLAVGTMTAVALITEPVTP